MKQMNLRRKPFAVKNDFDARAGSALLWILIAVALFAALGFAVTRGIRGGGEEVIASDVARTRAIDIIQFANGLRGAVRNLRVEGIAAQAVSFETPLLAGYNNAGCTEAACRVFGGGGVAYREPPADWFDSAQSAQPLFGQWYFPANLCVEDAGSGGAGCNADGEDNEDLVAILPWLRREICVEINEKLGIANPGGNPPVEVGNGWTLAGTKFTGSFADSEILSQSGQGAGCFAGNGAAMPPAGSYAFYQVLLAR